MHNKARGWILIVRLLVGIAVLGLLGIGSTGCMAVASPAVGVLFTEVQGPLDAEGPIGRKRGEACAQSIHGLVAEGDASIKAAADNGGITNVTSVEHSTRNILGIIGTFCTIVRGS